MATTVTNTEGVAQKKIGLGGGGPSQGRKLGPNGGGPRKDGRGGEGSEGERLSGSSYRIGMWVALAAVAMMFTALTSAYIVRASTSNDWQPISVPRMLWFSTGLIFFSSITFEIARRSLKKGSASAYKGWLLLTVLLGLGFLMTQLLAWRELVAQGIYLSSNPHSSFFYLLTGAHGVHLLGGVLALDYLLLRSLRKPSEQQGSVRRQAAADAVALYWHFMDGLWVYLFLLLFLWR
jgi:cytochrome c oxidase subunit 3